jgi:hypothetical protein
MSMENPMLRPTAARVTADLRVVTRHGSIKLTPDAAFSVARELIRRGARAIVREETGIPTPRPKASAGKRKVAR